MARRLQYGILLLGVLVSVLAFFPALVAEPPFGTVYGIKAPALGAAIHVLVGLSFVVFGVATWANYPGRNAGRLMVAVGFLWFVSDLAWLRWPLPFTVARCAGLFYLAAVAHLYVSFPEKISARWERVLVLLIYVWLLLGQLVEVAFWDPRLATTRASPRNLLLVRADPALNDAIARWNAVIGAAAVAAVVFVVVRHWQRSTPLGRRALTPVLVASVPLTLAVLAAIVDGAVSMPIALHDSIWDLIPLGLAALSIGFLVGILRSQLAHAAVSQLLIRLGQTAPVAQLQYLIARALRDPSVEVGIWDPQQSAFLDHTGRTLDPADPGPGRDAWVFSEDGEPTGALFFDSSLRDEPELLESVAAAVRLSVENERLHARVAAQLAEVEESRKRILEEGDEARRQIERDIHDGAQQRLVSIKIAINAVRAQSGVKEDVLASQALAEIAHELGKSLEDLRNLAQGIHPSILTEAGLGPALETLAETSRIPTVVQSVTCGRLPAPVEATLYFVVAEALANAAKHSGASFVEVSVTQENGHVALKVADDGVGGANLINGSGLRGLIDRVATLSGRFDVRSPVGGGTVLEVQIPCESS